jgi:aquaporin Z
MRSYITEFIGTFFLVFTVALTCNPQFAHLPGANPAMAPLAIGSSLMIMVYMGGHISGGHYNPAVSLAVLLRGKMKGKDFAPYLVAQFLGGLVAAYIAFLVLGQSTKIEPTPLPAVTVSAPAAATAPAAPNFEKNAKTEINLGWCLLIESLFTFALALVVLNAATAKETAGNSFYGLAIGFTIVVAAFAGGPISGGAFNPAVGTGITAIHAFCGGGEWKFLWLYILGPLLGGAAAALVFKEQHPEGA